MALSNDIVKWHCQMALSNGVVKWRCQMALLNGVVKGVVEGWLRGKLLWSHTCVDSFHFEFTYQVLNWFRNLQVIHIHHFLEGRLVG